MAKKQQPTYLVPEDILEVPKDRLRIVPLGGLGEIGMNCMVLETTDDMIVLDCGKLFSDLSAFGVNAVIPDFRYVKARLNKLRALVITHGHEDHLGSVTLAVSQGIQVPIYASPFTRRMIEDRLAQAGLEDHKRLLKTYNIGETIDLPSFKIQTLPVTHSLVECAGFILQTPIGKIVETGDWRIDDAPYYPTHIDWDVLKKAASEGVLLLMSDSTNIENYSDSMTEETVGQNLEKQILESKGKIFITLFASNIARMAQIFEIAEKFDRKVALCGRSMDNFFQITSEFEYVVKGRNCFISTDEIHKYPKEKVLILCTGSQAENRSALARMAKDEYPWVKIEPGDTVLYSARIIPGNEKAISRLINDLMRRGADVKYERFLGIHASGHATRPELKRMITTVKPHFFVPIHGEFRHLIRHRELALEAGIPAENTIVIQNYDVLEVGKEALTKIGSLETERVYIGDPDDSIISREVIRSRRAMGEHGQITAVVPVSANDWSLDGSIRILQHGICPLDESDFLLEEIEDVIVDTLEESVPHEDPATLDALEEDIRISIRRHLFRTMDKKIPVSVVVVEI